MKKVLMLKNALGVRDGSIHAAVFCENREYEIDDSLFKQFNILGVVKEVEETKEVIQSIKTEINAFKSVKEKHEKTFKKKAGK